MGILTIRPAEVHEADALTQLALRSKAYWGYSAEFMEACRSELTVTPGMIQALPIMVAQSSGRLAGFFLLSTANQTPDTELSLFFVDPAFIGCGVGRRLWDCLVKETASRGISSFKILSDPQAEAFYLKMGAKRIGVGQSSLRELPLLGYTLP